MQKSFVGKENFKSTSPRQALNLILDFPLQLNSFKARNHKFLAFFIFLNQAPVQGFMEEKGSETKSSPFNFYALPRMRIQ